MYVAIPLNQPASRSVADVKALIEDKQRAKLIEQGQDPDASKVLECGVRQIQFYARRRDTRQGSYTKSSLCMGFGRSLGKPAVNTAFITEVVDRLRASTEIQMDALFTSNRSNA